MKTLKVWTGPLQIPLSRQALSLFPTNHIHQWYRPVSFSILSDLHFDLVKSCVSFPTRYNYFCTDPGWSSACVLRRKCPYAEPICLPRVSSLKYDWEEKEIWEHLPQTTISRGNHNNMCLKQIWKIIFIRFDLLTKLRLWMGQFTCLCLY